MVKLGVPLYSGCVFPFRCGGGAAVPPASAATLPGVSDVLASPSPVASAGPAVQAVAVSNARVSHAAVLRCAAGQHTVAVRREATTSFEATTQDNFRWPTLETQRFVSFVSVQHVFTDSAY